MCSSVAPAFVPIVFGEAYEPDRLDDPTREAIVRHIHDLAAADNIGVLWATHLFDEVESDDALVVINKGRVVAEGSVTQIEKQAGAETLAEAFRRLTGDRVEEVAV